MPPSTRHTRQSSYPSAPASAASALFQYNSIARPPTGYSNASLISPSSPAPPVPNGTNQPQTQTTHPRRPYVRQTSADGLLVDHDDYDSHSDAGGSLYARSDWTKGEHPIPRSPLQVHSQRSTTYSEYPPTTALPTQGDGRETPMYAQSEWESQYGGMETPGVAKLGDEEEAEEEGLNTAWSKSSYAPRGTVLDTVYEEPLPLDEGGYEDASGGHRTSARQRASTLASAVDISERDNPFDQRHSSVYQQNPLSAKNNTGLHRRGPSSESVTNRAPGPAPPAAPFTPHAHQKLGRMSVAPARYTLPPSQIRPSPTNDEGGTPQTGDSNPYAPPGGLRFQQNQPTAAQSGKGIAGLGEGLALRPDDMGSRLKVTRIGQLYMTYRPFLTPVVLMMSAMVMTLAMQSGGSLGTFVKVQQGGFGGKVGEGTGGVIGLGVAGWCQLETDNPICKSYKRGDFVSSKENFQIPGPDSLQAMLNYLLGALTGLTWLLAVYHLTIAFLHFFLLFGLSIPWDFFTTSDPLPPLTGVPNGRVKDAGATLVCPSEDEVVQKEVDMRVRCERPPYDAYEWVWWAWWAHRRGPVGHAFAVAVGVVGLCATGIAAQFYLQVSGAAAEHKASISAGTLVPVMAVIFALDPIISAAKYLLYARYNFDRFNNPPAPTPAAILLPPNARPMRHIRNTGAASYFAAQEDPLQVDTLFAVDPLAPPIPPLTARTPHPPIDPETVRWLAAYPLDTDLVSLIADLRAGKESEDFVLSDVGLLYLRPDPNVGNEGGDALLVPPAGQIRDELLKDAHFEVLEGGDEGGSAHWGPETMVAKMGETFWWPGIEDDCRELVQGCKRCMRDGLDVEVEAEEMEEMDLKPGMTPLPFTGMKTDGAMTGMMTNAGESAIAADMAFAMRKAQDEARRDVLHA